MAGIWYRTGTITLTQGSQVVSGVGTTFASNARVGDMLIGPLMDLYEVSDVLTDSQIRIDRNYEAASYTGTDWSIAPTSAQLKQLAKQITDLIAIYQDIPEAASDAAAAVINAQAAASQAGISAAASLASEQSANTWKTQAAGSASAAADAASAASASASTASTKASEAATSATQALGYRDESQAIKDSLTASAVTSVAGKTGAVTLAKGDVGLGNVDNLSRAQILESPAITGTPTGLTKAHVGLGNVSNLTPADMPISTAVAGAIQKMTFRAYRSGSYPIPNGVQTPLYADAFAFGTQATSGFNPANGQFKPTKQGWYLIGVNWLFNAASDIIHSTVSLLLNNVDYGRVAMTYGGAGSGKYWWGGNGSIPVYFNGTTDTLTVSCLITTADASNGTIFGGDVSYSSIHAIYLGA